MQIRVVCAANVTDDRNCICNLEENAKATTFFYGHYFILLMYIAANIIKHIHMHIYICTFYIYIYIHMSICIS